MLITCKINCKAIENHFDDEFPSFHIFAKRARALASIINNLSIKSNIPIMNKRQISNYEFLLLCIFPI